jgi:chemotaxis protein MotA
MDPATLIGIGLAGAALLVGVILEGGNPMAFIAPSAFLIVFGGTAGAMVASSGIKPFLQMPKLMIASMKYKGNMIDKVASIRVIVGMAEKARREGLLALEEEAQTVSDPFLRKGISLVVDGTDPELVKDILESDLDAMEARHSRQAGLYMTMGGFAPTLGIIGTVMGLVHVLQHLSAPETLGPSISGAFIATLMGVGAANVVFLPVASRLKGLSHEELHARNLVLEGILSIQAGDNPRVVSEKLMSLVPPADRISAEEAKPNLRLADAPADAAEAAA